MGLTRALALGIVSLSIACTGGQMSGRDAGKDATVLDGTIADDLGVEDLGSGDAAEPDTGVIDTGSIDTGTTDALVSDTGVNDAGVIDAGAIDTGVVDAGMDAGIATGTLLLLGGGSSSILTAQSRDGTSWQTGTLADSTDVAPVLALSSSVSAVAVIRSTAASGALRYSTWSPSSFTPFLGIAAGVTTRAVPSMIAAGAGAELVFHGDNFRHYYARWSSFSWSPTAEPIAFQANPSFGPTPASVAVIGGDTIAAYAGNNGDLYDQTRSGGVWSAGAPHNLGGGGPTLTPVIVALTGSDDAMIVFVRSSDARIRFTTRTGGVWSAAADVDATALTDNPVALLPLTAGGALLAYRGQNAGLYWSRYAPGTGWSVPASIATVNPTTSTTPALAPGIGSAEAELAFVAASGGAAQHARFSAGTWGAPVTIGGTGLLGIAIASRPW